MRKSMHTSSKWIKFHFVSRLLKSVAIIFRRNSFSLLTVRFLSIRSTVKRIKCNRQKQSEVKMKKKKWKCCCCVFDFIGSTCSKCKWHNDFFDGEKTKVLTEHVMINGTFQRKAKWKRKEKCETRNFKAKLILHGAHPWIKWNDFAKWLAIKRLKWKKLVVVIERQRKKCA